MKSMRHRPRPWARRGFELRLLGALAVTLLAVGAMQYVLTSEHAKGQLVTDAAMRAQGDVVFVQDAFGDGLNTERRAQRMQERLAAIATREGVEYVYLLDQYGVVVSSADGNEVGKFRGGNEFQDVIDSGTPSTSVVNDDAHRSYRYIVPVDLPAGRYALELRQDESVIAGQLSALRQSTLLVTLIGLAVGALAFFLLGGRSVATMYRRALQLSTRDGLTNLENHRAFKDALQRNIALANRENTPVSLVIVDLDDFRVVNERDGHNSGDELLKRVADLVSSGPEGDQAFRIAGDEFAVILFGSGAEQAYVEAERMARAIENFGEVSACVGVATIAPDTEVDDLHDHALAALAEAKHRGPNNLVTYEELGDSSSVTSSKIRLVRKLIDSDEIGTAFQPIWNVHADRPLGFEALARPPAEYELGGPAPMFEIAEMIGRTPELDAMAWRWALERSRDVPEDVLLFLNVSPFTANRGDGPIDRLCEIVREAGREPGRIVVEITERWAGHRETTIEQAERLRAAGFCLALDDVGAGSGDLEMMARLPVDFIKVDMHIVKTARLDAASRGVLFAIAAFAAHSGSRVIVEGVEDQSVLAFVEQLAEDPVNPLYVSGAQGYYLGRPVAGAPQLTAPQHRPLTKPSPSRWFVRSDA